MKETITSEYDRKQYKFSTYFILNRGKLFTTDNFNFEDNLKNCLYVKKYGSNNHPKIYLDTKVNNTWTNKNQLIGDYYSFIEFIPQNEKAFICIRGFSRAGIGRIIRMANELKGTNIKPVKFKNKLVAAQYERHLLKKEERIEELKERIDNIGELENAEKYMKICNYVYGKDRHKSRRKILKLQRK